MLRRCFRLRLGLVRAAEPEKSGYVKRAAVVAGA
jgi:hypothetical protein